MRWMVLNADGDELQYIETESDDPTDDEIFDAIRNAGIKLNGDHFAVGAADEDFVIYDELSDEDIYYIESEEYDEDY